MTKDTIVVIDLGSRENDRLIYELEELGLHCELLPHTVTAEELKQIPSVKGVILNGGPDCRGRDVSTEIYNAPMPVLLVDHKGDAPWPAEDAARREALVNFLFFCGICPN